MEYWPKLTGRELGGQGLASGRRRGEWIPGPIPDARRKTRGEGEECVKRGDSEM